MAKIDQLEGWLAGFSVVDENGKSIASATLKQVKEVCRRLGWEIGWIEDESDGLYGVTIDDGTLRWFWRERYFSEEVVISGGVTIEAYIDSGKGY